MTEQQITALVKQQNEFFKSGTTLPLYFRIKQLKKLYKAVKKYQTEINTALQSDLGKSGFESFMCETGLVLSEISYMLRNIKKFAKQKTVKTPISQFCAKSFVKPMPYGNTLIMSPWNYPLLLTLDPLTNAIAAGNTAVVKPSAYSPATAEIIEKIITETFNPKYIAVVKGGREQNTALLEQKFDFIFFTGSEAVGKHVLRCAAENLTPVVLELGGKSPCIVDRSANIKLAAKRIVFGKFLNCGQTCVAPDYILCESCVKQSLIDQIKYQITEQFGTDPLNNTDYGKIVNRKHFDRLCGLINNAKVVAGGKTNAKKLKIEPTVMDNVLFSDKVMGEEIFGPILPVIEFESFDQTVSLLKEKNKPLALYIFSENKQNIKKAVNQLQYGGGCINDVVIHLATSEMGFGGVGESGMGSYHGKSGFDAFTHYKSVVNKKTWIDLPVRYQPYNNRLFKKAVKLLLK